MTVKQLRDVLDECNQYAEVGIMVTSDKGWHMAKLEDIAPKDIGSVVLLTCTVPDTLKAWHK